MLTFVNGVWTKKTFYNQLEHGLLETLDRNYFADFKFFRSNPVLQLNIWANRTTRGKIEKLVGKSSSIYKILYIRTIRYNI